MFNPCVPRVRTHDLYILTVHFTFVRLPSKPLSHQGLDPEQTHTLLSLFFSYPAERLLIISFTHMLIQPMTFGLWRQHFRPQTLKLLSHYEHPTVAITISLLLQVSGSCWMSPVIDLRHIYKHCLEKICFFVSHCNSVLLFYSIAIALVCITHEWRGLSFFSIGLCHIFVIYGTVQDNNMKTSAKSKKQKVCLYWIKLRGFTGFHHFVFLDRVVSDHDKCSPWWQYVIIINWQVNPVLMQNSNPNI